MENVAVISGQRRLGQVLVDQGLISRRDLARALEVQLRTRDRLGRILMSLDIIRRRQLYPVLAEMWGLPFVDLLAIRPDPKLVKRFDSRLMMDVRFVPVRLYLPESGQRYCLVATSDEPTETLAWAIKSVVGSDVDVH